jgi:hypothetical protein
MDSQNDIWSVVAGVGIGLLTVLQFGLRPTTTKPAVLQGPRIDVFHPDGTEGTIPVSEIPEAIRQGFTLPRPFLMPKKAVAVQ